jgi:hypothetical protein
MITKQLKEELENILSDSVRDFGGKQVKRSFRKFGKVRRSRGLVDKDQTIQQAIPTPILSSGRKKMWMP